MVLAMKKSRFRFYRDEELTIDSIDSRLTGEEKRLRRYIMNTIIDRACPYNLEENLERASADLDIPVEKVRELEESLREKRVVSIQDGFVNFIYPVSALVTNHKVHLSDGREFFAMCAIDGIGTSFTFKQDISLSSSCSKCGEEVYLELVDGEILKYYPEDLHVLHVDLNKNRDWSGNCWNIMNFFCKKDHYDQWVEDLNISKDDIFCLSVDEAWHVSKMLFSVTDI